MSNIEINDLASAIAKELTQYSKEAENAVKDEIDKLSKELVKDLKKDKNIPKRTGKYKKSFYVKKLSEGKGRKKVVIANKIYRLTHLLEKGHVNFYGGMRTKAYPHWIHAQRKANELPERIERRLSKI